MKLPHAYVILILAFGRLVTPAFAGEYHNADQLACSDCHIMHSSKNNQLVASSKMLIKHPGGEVGLCLSCHDGTDPNAPDTVSTGTSVSPAAGITTPYSSKYGSSAGFFQADYSTSPNPYGHDLYSAGTVTAPLSSTFSRVGGLVCSSCHDPHGTPNYRNLLSDPNPNHPGSVQILIGTQVKETAAVNALTPNPAQAYDTGNIGFFTANNIRAWCSDCHDQMASDTNGGSPAHFMGHPSDVAINGYQHTSAANWTAGTIGGETGFGTDIDDGTAGIPRLRFGSASGGSNTASSNDTVTCLTCHKAHGSKYHAGLTWPYKTSSPDQYSGCQQCHFK